MTLSSREEGGIGVAPGTASRVRSLGSWAILVALMTCVPAPLVAQELSLGDVLRRARGAVVEHEDQLSTVVAEERYEQRTLTGDGNVAQRRTLVSDYRVTQLLPLEFWFGVREVFEVDGEAIRERTIRPHGALRLARGEDAVNRLTRIAEENARFNIGDVTRTFNEPTFVLAFLHPRNRERMRFEHVGYEVLDELSTWVIGYQEVPAEGTSFIETEDGDHLLTRGRFWIEPVSGRVVRSQLVAGDGRLARTATITVDYRLSSVLHIWLPTQMHEVYEATDGAREGTTIVGTATYSNYRLLREAVAWLSVAWDPSRDPDVVGYVVRWGQTSGDYDNEIDVGDTSRVRLDGLVEGQRYYLTVSSYTATGLESQPVEEASGVAGVSSRPQQRN